MKIEHTERGFELIRFSDRYGVDCSLQQSSLADYEKPGSSAIWLGVDSVRYGMERMHIDLEQLKELLLHLQAWVETGSFELER